MGTVPIIPFTGQSSFSASLQAELNREVQIASLPIQLMQSDVATLQSQQQALTSLQVAFGSLESALQSIGSSTTGNLAATVSDPSVLSASVTSAALPGTYSVQVDQIGTNTTTLSNAGPTPVTDPSSGNISSSSTFTLTVNGTNYTITPAGNDLNSLAAAINAAGAGVQATVVNVGGSTPDYRLALSSTSLGNNTIQLNDGTNNLLNTISPGSDTLYQVNGSGVEVQSTTNTVTLATGVTLNLLQASGSPVTVTVGSSYSSLSTALSNFATAYNSAQSALGQQIGQNAGPLAGQSIVYSLSNTLSSLVNYTSGTGAVSSLASLGLTLDQNGQLNFDPTVLSGLNISDVQQFLGSTSTGGFLQVANNSLTSMADPTVGAIQSDFNSLQTEVTNENSQISDAEAMVNDMATSLQQQLSLADATIANLEAQKTYYTDLFNAQYPSAPPPGG